MLDEYLSCALKEMSSAMAAPARGSAMKSASRDAKTRTAAEMKEAVDQVILATSKRARKMLDQYANKSL